MTRFTDGFRFLEISMKTWSDGQYSPDFSGDFFEVGGLPYEADVNAYKVADLDYLVEQAGDWSHAEGDFYEPDAKDVDDRCVSYEYKETF